MWIVVSAFCFLLSALFMNSVIKVEGLSKRYRLGTIGRTALHEDMSRWWARLRGRPDPTLRIDQAARRDAAALRDDAEHVWALRDVSFDLKQGEVLGIIGRNGAGKSTLLKILSQVTAPTLGCVKIKGRIASLLEVGTGFHPELTGRENIFLNGAILGMRRHEIRSKLDEIVAFSGCEKFIDTPVKRYSSGMYVRLAFAVAAHLDPEILVVDEVLAVGDASFQAKCLGKMSEVASAGRTILFVSHNLAAVQNLCQNAIWLDGGAVAMDKQASANVVAAYERTGRQESGAVDVLPSQHRALSAFQIHRVEVLGQEGRPTPVVRWGERICVRLFVSCSESMEGVHTGIGLRSNGMILSTLLSEDGPYEASDRSYAVDCEIPPGVLQPGMFEIDVGASMTPGNVGLDYVKAACAFCVSDTGIDAGWVHNRRQHGVVRIPGEWRKRLWGG
jgi:lipopolysaccharide transport system ATP-binding protein